MKHIEIFILGNYQHNTKTGNWIYYLNYKKAVIKRCGQVKDAGSLTRISLYSLYQALSHVTEPCNILVHSKYPLGFKHPKKSVNKDLLVKIQNIINKAGHVIVFDTADDFGRVDIWEQTYGVDKKNAHPDIKNKTTPNSVFEHNDDEEEQNLKEQSEKHADWREMYSDLMGPSQGTWVPGSGGY